MRLMNKTNEETTKLKQFGLVDQWIGVDSALVKPGESVEISEENQARIEAEHKHLFEVGALAWKADEPAREPPPVVEAAPEPSRARRGAQRPRRYEEGKEQGAIVDGPAGFSRDDEDVPGLCPDGALLPPGLSRVESPRRGPRILRPADRVGSARCDL
jgi:hypothetical protein